MSRTITYSLFNPKAWEDFGLDAVLSDVEPEVRNEWRSEYGDSSGQEFAVREGYHAPDGRTYHVLFATEWTNEYAPWTSGSTHATLYDTSDADDMVEFAAAVAEWEAKPEEDPAAEWPSDDDESEDESSAVRYFLRTHDGETLIDGLSLTDDEARQWADRAGVPLPTPHNPAMVVPADDGRCTMLHAEPTDAPGSEDVPNLDAMEADELRAWPGRMLGTSHPAPDDVKARLYRYAMLKADAMEQRLAGRSDQALRIERQLEDLYRQIPAPYRW